MTPIEQIKQIIVSEIESHLPWQQLSPTVQMTFLHNLEKILEEYKTSILNDKKAVLEWVLKNI